MKKYFPLIILSVLSLVIFSAFAYCEYVFLKRGVYLGAEYGAIGALLFFPLCASIFATTMVIINLKNKQ